MHRYVVRSAIAAPVVAVGCGGGSENPAPGAVASVVVTPATASVESGSTLRLSASARDASGNALSGRTISWESSSTSIATVDGTGLVTAVAEGSATVTASSDGEQGSAAITVTAPTAPSAR